MRATAGHAVYEGAGEWLHLTLNPRVEDGAMQLSADRLDVSQVSGDAFAHGNVKATWLDNGKSNDAQASGRTGGGTGQETMALGGQGPAHAIAPRGAAQPRKRRGHFPWTGEDLAAGQLDCRAGDCDSKAYENAGGAQCGPNRAGMGCAVEHREPGDGLRFEQGICRNPSGGSSSAFGDPGAGGRTGLLRH